MSEITPATGAVDVAVRQHYEELFRQQLANFRRARAPSSLIAFFDKSRLGIIHAATIRHYADRHIPFLLVIPIQCLGLYGLIRLIEVGGLRGFLEYPVKLVQDMVNTSVAPYVVLDVEDGTATLGQSGLEVEQSWLSEQRVSPLSCAETIMLGAHHSPTPLHHGLLAMGSRCPGQRNTSVPGLEFRFGRATLSYQNPDLALAFWGTPTCAERIFLS